MAKDVSKAVGLLSHSSVDKGEVNFPYGGESSPQLLPTRDVAFVETKACGQLPRVWF